ncbi:unnamed protein product [Sphenostylis stenocarpa]|uniref:Uncharacterized protein n=1 Tax=Sphenostylis stenocarpa TaxID=92480 RepID=A0AA86S3G4_9FABA|nr:unnamed protein product [Sphenostylis stenocarpa]
MDQKLKPMHFFSTLLRLQEKEVVLWDIIVITEKKWLMEVSMACGVRVNMENH